MGKRGYVEETVKVFDEGSGEMVMAREVRRYDEAKVKDRFMLLRTNDGVNWLLGLSGNEWKCLTILMYIASCTPMGRAVWGFGSAYNMSKALDCTVQTVYTLLRKLEQKCYIAKVGNGDIMINPDVYVGRQGGMYTRDMAMFKKLIDAKEYQTRSDINEQLTKFRGSTLTGFDKDFIDERIEYVSDSGEILTGFKAAQDGYLAEANKGGDNLLSDSSVEAFGKKLREE